MFNLVTIWLQVKVDRRAVTALEYGLLAGLIVATIMVGFGQMANSLSTKFSSVGAHL
jgi:Flp pilus assembly pilin Flp